MIIVLCHLSNFKYIFIYFRNEVLQTDPYGLDNGLYLPEWRLSLCLLFSWMLLFLVMVKGVASSGKVAYFTALFPYVVLFILLGRGATLPGAYEGVMFFIKPQWDKLLTIEVRQRKRNTTLSALNNFQKYLIQLILF